MNGEKDPQKVMDLEVQIHESLLNGIAQRVPKGPKLCLFGSGGEGGSGPGGDGDGNNGSSVDLKDVGGLTEEINFLKRSVLFPLANKEALAKWGFIPPKGIIFHGSPGTGKTLLAKAIATELSQNMKTKVKFIYRKGSDCHGKWFGESSSNLRQIFKYAEENKPALIFFDEIDGLCPSRESNDLGSEVYSSVVTTFLGMMDGIKNGEVFVIGATNRLQALDPALRRPGRFDKELRFNPPDADGRKIILRIHTKNWKTNSKPSETLLAEIATATSGVTGAYLENLCSEASNCAIQRYKVANNIDMLTVEDLTQIVVAREDWLLALRQIGRPQTNLFGSVLYVPQSEPKVEPLLAGQVEGIKTKILNMQPFDEGFKTLKTFLVYGLNSTASTFIIPHVLSTKEFQKIRTYLMTLESVSRDFYYAVGSIMNQVLSSTDPCILYLQDCSTLFNVLSFNDLKYKTASLQFLINKLRLTSGRPVMILGTSGCAPNNLPSETKEIFRGSLDLTSSYKVRYPTEDERRMFFKTVLRRNAYQGGAISGQMDSFFKKTLETCVKITENDDIENLVKLHSDLFLTGRKFMEDEQAFVEEMEKIVDNY